jgi:hypothetical protein
MIITTVSFIALLVNWYSNRLLPLVRQFFHFLNTTNVFTDLRPSYVFYLLLKSILADFEKYLAIKSAISTSIGLGSSDSSCMHFYLPNITDIMHI